MTPRHLPGLHPRAWEHPADRAALDALRRIPGLPELSQATLGRVTDPIWGVVFHKARPCRREDFPRVVRAYEQVLDTLDSPLRPTLLVGPSEHLNAATMGLREPRILLTMGAIRGLSDRELQVVLAHELGHALSGHAMYRGTLGVLLSLSGLVVPIPALLNLSVLVAMLEWSRKSELSADRASLFAVQDVGLVVETLRRAHQNPEIPQAWQERLKGRIQPHPPFHERAAELEAFAASEDWARAMAGDYPRREVEAPGLDWGARVREMGQGMAAFWQGTIFG